MNNIITIAVREHRPELITSHFSFDVARLADYNCGMGNILNLSISCYDLNCRECPFSCELNGATLESMKQWLKLEPSKQSTQPITYSEEEVKNLLEKYRNYAEIHGLKTIKKNKLI